MVPVAGLAPRGNPDFRGGERGQDGKDDPPGQPAYSHLHSKLTWLAAAWGAALLLLAFQWLCAGALEVANGGARVYLDGEVVISYGWRLWGTIVPFGLVLPALVLQIRWFRGIWKGLAVLGLLLAVPAFLASLFNVMVIGLGPLDSVRLGDGRRFVLASEMIGLDSVAGIYVPKGPLGLVWRQDAGVSYAEDGHFTSIALVVSPDERWLLVKRGAFWTDCYRIARPGRIGPRGRSALEHCSLSLMRASANHPDAAATWSRRIEAITGVRASR